MKVDVRRAPREHRRETAQLRWFPTWILRDKEAVAARNGENPIPGLENVTSEDTEGGHMEDEWNIMNKIEWKAGHPDWEPERTLPVRAPVSSSPNDHKQCLCHELVAKIEDENQ